MNIYESLLSTAKNYPDKLALVYKGQKETFPELLNKVQRLMTSFQTLGMKKGEKLAIYLPNCPQYIYAYLAALGLGVTVVPLDPSIKQHELKNILAHAEVNYLIAKELFTFDLPSFKKTITDIDNLINNSQSAAPREELIKEKELAIIIYTSGTTGRPKAIPLTYRHLDSPVATMKYFDLIEPFKVLICYVPLSHAGGLVYLLMLACTGSSLVLGERFTPGRFLKDIETYGVTGSWVPPTILEAMLKTREINKVKLDSLKLIVYFGAPASPRLLKEFEERFPHVTGITGWGMTESAAPNVLLPQNAPPEKRFRKGILGKHAPWVEIKIVDDKGDELPCNEIGEILLKGWFVMPGYYKEPELTKEIIKDGWLYTGDLGYLDEEGYLYITGRKKEVIITGGINVYANEVEFVIAEHPKVAEVAVVGVQDGLRGEVVKAVVVSKNGLQISPQEIIRFCRKKLSGYKVPRVIEFRNELPKTPLGKIKKAELI